MTTTTIDGAYRVLDAGDPQEPDAYLGPDDFAAGGRDIRVEGNDPSRALAARVANPGQSLTPLLFGGAVMALGVRAGRTPAQRAVLGALGAAAGVLLYEAAAAQGWVE